MLAPIFTFSVSGEKISCKVVLSNRVGPPVRESCSTDLWTLGRCTYIDAASSEYVGLHHTGLVNDNLLHDNILPLPKYNEATTKAYTEIAKRPAVPLTRGKFNP